MDAESVSLTLRVVMGVQVEWELLFSSAQHGHSFNALLMKVLDAGPTLLLVRDKQGHLFGGFASESWHKNGQFYGVPESSAAIESECFTMLSLIRFSFTLNE